MVEQTSRMELKCPTLMEIYEAVIDIERRIHVVRTLLKRLHPETELKWGPPAIGEQWRPVTEKEKLGGVICDSCNRGIVWDDIK